MGAEVGLGEGDRERGVGGEVEGGVPFAPVSGIILSVLLKRCRRGWAYLITAMFTGAVVLAR